MRLRVIVVAVLVVVVVGGAGGWYYLYGPCGVVAVRDAAEEFEAIMAEWEDAVQIADATSRISLSGPVSDLQAIRRQAEGIEAPACLVEAQTLMVDGMEAAVQGYLAFMGEESDQVISAHFETAAIYVVGASLEWERVAECAPFCVTSEEALQTAIAALPPSATPTSSATPRPPTATPDPCPQAEARAFAKQILGLFKEYQEAFDAVNLRASVTVETALIRMDDIRDDLRALETPQCGMEARDALDDAIAATADLLQAILNDREEDAAASGDRAELALDDFIEALEEFGIAAGFDVSVAP